MTILIVHATKNVQGNITFDLNTQLEKKIIFLLRKYMPIPFIKILWTSNQNWLHRNLSRFSIVHSMDNCPLGINLPKKRKKFAKISWTSHKYLKETFYIFENGNFWISLKICIFAYKTLFTPPRLLWGPLDPKNTFKVTL